MTYQQNNNTEDKIQKELSIQISLSGLSFCILNTKTHTIDFLKKFPTSTKKTPFQILDKLQILFKEQEQFNQKFDNVTIVYVNEISTVVPNALFKEEFLADYLKFNSKILKTDFISYDEIKAINAVNVYVPYVNINNYIYDRFGSFTYKHFSTVLIENLQKIETSKTDQKIYINVNSSHFEIISFRNNDLIFYNTFEYSTKEDFIYYLLFTIEQLNLNPEILELIFLGEINITDDLYKIAYKYIRNVSFGKHLKDYNYKDTSVPIHYNFTLLNSF